MHIDRTVELESDPEPGTYNYNTFHKRYMYYTLILIFIDAFVFVLEFRIQLLTIPCPVYCWRVLYWQKLNFFKIIMEL